MTQWISSLPLLVSGIFLFVVYGFLGSSIATKPCEEKHEKDDDIDQCVSDFEDSKLMENWPGIPRIHARIAYLILGIAMVILFVWGLATGMETSAGDDRIPQVLSLVGSLVTLAVTALLLPRYSILGSFKGDTSTTPPPAAALMAMNKDNKEEKVGVNPALVEQWGMMFGLLKDGAERSDLVHTMLIAVLVVFSLLPLWNLFFIINK